MSLEARSTEQSEMRVVMKLFISCVGFYTVNSVGPSLALLFVTPSHIPSLSLNLFSTAIKASQMSPIPNLPHVATDLMLLFTCATHDCWH